jgi:hypothetical protein
MNTNRTFQDALQMMYFMKMRLFQAKKQGGMCPTVDSSSWQDECEQQTARVIETGRSFAWHCSPVHYSVKVPQCSFSCRKEIAALKSKVMAPITSLIVF